MAAQGGRSGEADVSIDNAATVGDFQAIMTRAMEANRFLQDQITHIQNSAGARDQQHDMEMAQIRIELRQAQAGIQMASNASGGAATTWILSTSSRWRPPSSPG